MSVLPLALIPAGLRYGWQVRDAVVAAVEVLGSSAGNDPHQLPVVRFGALWGGVLHQALSHQPSPPLELRLRDLHVHRHHQKRRAGLHNI